MALTVVGAWSSARPMSGAELEQADQAYAQAEADWKQSGDQQMADCLTQQTEAQKTDPNADFGCDQMAPQREWFVRTPPAFGQYVPGIVSGMVFLLGFLALIAGATFTAAEVSSRSLTTWLTFEPRRIRVLTSKLAAAGAGMVLPAAVLVALAVGGAMGAFAIDGAGTAMTAAEVTATVHASLRLVALASLVAVVASALGLLLPPHRCRARRGHRVPRRGREHPAGALASHAALAADDERDGLGRREGPPTASRSAPPRPRGGRVPSSVTR